MISNKAKKSGKYLDEGKDGHQHINHYRFLELAKNQISKLKKKESELKKIKN